MLSFDNSRDFPFYNGNPHVSMIQWIVMLISILLSLIVYSCLSEFSELIGSIFFCLVMLIPLLYYSNWNYMVLFQKPTKDEIILAVLMFIGYLVYTIVMVSVLEQYNVTGNNLVDPVTINVESLIPLIFQIASEELIKFIPLMFFMRLFYRITDNRNISFLLSAFLICMGFGLLHYTDSVISALLLQGLGTTFELYAYAKSKNLFIPFLTHYLTDAFIFILIIL